MGNVYANFVTVLVDPPCQVDAGEIREFAELFYPGQKPGFIRVRVTTEPGEKGRRGECCTAGRVHSINLFWNEIKKSAEAKHILGGNLTWSADVRTVVFLVLAHELRHAYQSELHWNKEKFFTKRGYASRPCEVDARRYVDESYTAICEFLDVKPEASITSRSKDMPEETEITLSRIVEEMVEGDTAGPEWFRCDDDGKPWIDGDEIKFELEAVGLNNPISFGTVVHMLAEEGVRVV